MSAASLQASDAASLERCVREGGVAVFPADTVYGLCCDPNSEAAAARLYELKGRPPERPSAVMFFALAAALEALPELRDAENEALAALLPGPVTLLLPNRSRRFVSACGPDPDTVGLRVPRLPDALAALRSVDVPVMQSSANISGAPDARTLAEVPPSIREGVDLVLDGGELPGTPSTVIDLRDYAASREWCVVREGLLPAATVESMLGGSKGAKQ